MARFIYTDEMKQFMAAAYKKHRLSRVTELFNKRFGTDKSTSSIKAALGNHGITGGRVKAIPDGERRLKYTPEQIAWLKQMYPVLIIRELVVAFNAEFGLNESARQLYQFLKRHKITSGRDGQFRKGDAAWNRGVKGLQFSPATQFKPGSVPNNYRTVGSERINKDGYVMIKVSETRWRLKHRVVWEQLHGPVPAGHVIRFRDMDKTNITETNMTLVTRAEHAIINKLGIKRMPQQYEHVIKSVVKVRRASAERQRRQTKTTRQREVQS